MSVNRFTLLIAVIIIPIGLAAAEGDTWTILAPSGLTLRNAPTRDGQAIFVIPQGQTVTEIGRAPGQVAIDGVNGSWIKVKWGSISGWLFSGYMRPERQSDAGGTWLAGLLDRVRTKGMVKLSYGVDFTGRTDGPFGEHLVLRSGGKAEKILVSSFGGDRCPACGHAFDRPSPIISSVEETLAGTWRAEGTDIVVEFNKREITKKCTAVHACRNGGITREFSTVRLTLRFVARVEDGSGKGGLLRVDGSPTGRADNSHWVEP